jgi:hypothetical protein
MSTEATALAIVGVSEIVKLFIMAQAAGIAHGMTPEQMDALYNTVKSGFLARDPAKLPEV